MRWQRLLCTRNRLRQSPRYCFTKILVITTDVDALIVAATVGNRDDIERTSQFCVNLGGLSCHVVKLCQHSIIGCG